MAVDGYFDNVVLLLHGDGADAGSVFTDSSPTPKTVTGYGGATTSTAQSKFGGAAIGPLTGAQYLKVPHSSDFDFGSGNFTLEGWFYETTSGSNNTLLSKIMSPSGSTPDAFYLTSITGGRLRFEPMLIDASASGVLSSAVLHSLNAWHHFAVTKSGTTWRLFLDGALVASKVSDGVFDVVNAPLSIGVMLNTSQVPLAGSFFRGYLDDIRITKGVARYTSAFAAPTEAFPNEGAPSFTGSVAAPLPGTKLLGWHDFAGMLGDVTTVYVADLVTPGGLVRVPISSWQATLRTGGSSYVQCVVPACAPWLASINAATQLVIGRRAVLPSGNALDYEMARAPVEQVQFSQGPQRYTCTLSGYASGFAAVADPSVLYDRALTGVRSMASNSGSGLRVRCAVDWLLRPGQRAFVNGLPFVVGYINYYAPSGFDAYMDVGQQG